MVEQKCAWSSESQFVRIRRVPLGVRMVGRRKASKLEQVDEKFGEEVLGESLGELPAWHGVEELFREYKRTGDEAIRNEIIERHSNLVHAIARRFKDRGEPYEDLVQVAWYGLIKAVDRYDPDRGNKFTSFAVPTILGEIRRYFRDRGWDVRVPRKLQELNQQARRVVEELSRQLNRSPTIKEVANALGVSEEMALEALELARYYDLGSLNGDAKTASDEDDGQPASELVSSDDEIEFERMILRHAIEQAMARLDERERKIVEMTFYEGLPQTEIAKRLGISQMHVSRLLRKALSKLREMLSE